MLAFPQPHHLPCPNCGASLARNGGDEHECEDERRLDYLVLQLGDEVRLFDVQLAAWLGSPAGRFAAWLAEHER